MTATAMLEKSQSETETIESRSASVDQDLQLALESLKEIFSNYPVGLLKKALELTRVKDTQELNTNAAGMWIVNEGEKYLNKHLELYKGD